jgi:hypothetical protein
VKRSIFVFAALLLLPVFCSGTTLQKLTLPELRTHAASVVIGKVAELRYRTINGRIWTIVELQVEKTLKGNVSGRVHFRIPGGMQSVNGRTLVTRVDGVPQIESRDRGIFFLETNPPAFADLVGWNQGFYRLIEKNGKEYVLRSDQTQPSQTFEQFLTEFRKDFISK